jgi:hypothetical protein
MRIMPRLRCHYVLVVVMLAMLISLTPGCELGLQDAARAGAYDFIAGTITDSLTALFPLAELIAQRGA